MLDLDDFIAKLEEAIEVESASLTSSSFFRECEQWSSIAALSVVAMIFGDYGVQINGEELHSAKTVGDLYAMLKEKQGL